MTHGVIWYELMTTDQTAARAFYEPVLAWSIADATAGADMDYRMITGPGGLVGGTMALPPEAQAMGMRPGWFFYVSVDDVDAEAAAIVAAGGAMHMPPTDVPEAGRFAFVADPQGASFYIMTPNGTGPATAHRPETPGHGGWHELHARDGAAAMTFYQGRFGWSPDGEFDMGSMGLYRLFKIGEAQAGGMMDDKAAAHPHWLIYFNVESVATAAARVTAGGGQVASGPHQVPSGAWVLQGLDPQGATFCLVGPQ